MNEYSKKMIKVPTMNLFREQDKDKQPVLDVRNLGIDFGGLTAVDDFNLTVGRTEIAGLIGPNGAGKTTVFNLLTKVYQPTRGTILLDGVDTAGKTTIQVNRMGIARTFQNIRLFSKLSVLDNVLIGLHNEMDYRLPGAIFRLPGYWRGEKIARRRAPDRGGAGLQVRYEGLQQNLRRHNPAEEDEEAPVRPAVDGKQPPLRPLLAGPTWEQLSPCWSCAAGFGECEGRLQTRRLSAPFQAASRDLLSICSS